VSAPRERTGAARRPTVLAYYFPSWHDDPRNAAWFGEGFTEWSLLRDARPRFAGHRQPRVPALGEWNEADPEVGARQIELATGNGIDGFLIDYYWYDDGGYLEGALRDGLLRARNVGDMTFALMWANHELVDIFPAASADAPPPRLATGALDRAAFERFGRHIIAEYFTHPSYLRVEGRPWLSVYEIGSLIAGLGGVAETVDALDWLRAEAVSSGLPGIHLDAVIWGFGVLPTAVVLDDPLSLVTTLAFDSATSYVWMHHVDVDAHAFPAGDADRLRREAFADYERSAAALTVPFHPNVTVGWDSSPRTAQQLPFERGRYPFLTTWDATPAQFEAGLVEARSFADRHGGPHPIVTINAWNEWTEGSYLLPDTTHGMAYLDAVRRVFGR